MHPCERCREGHKIVEVTSNLECHRCKRQETKCGVWHPIGKRHSWSGCMRVFVRLVADHAKSFVMKFPLLSIAQARPHSIHSCFFCHCHVLQQFPQWLTSEEIITSVWTSLKKVLCPLLTYCPEWSSTGMGQFPICKLKRDFLRTSVTALESFMWKRKFKRNLWKKCSKNPLMGCC